MNIIKDTIYFKSTGAFFFKEQAGIKPNTTRFFTTDTPETAKELTEMEDFAYRVQEDMLYIEITNKISPHLTFKRAIRDISLAWNEPQKKVWIISWFHEDENGVTAGYNAPVKA